MPSRECGIIATYITFVIGIGCGLYRAISGAILLKLFPASLLIDCFAFFAKKSRLCVFRHGLKPHSMLTFIRVNFGLCVMQR
jgi:hypothetical protein